MRVEKLRAAFALDIVVKHFPLHPDTPDEGLTLEKLFAGRSIDIPTVKARMSRQMAEEGLPYGERTMTYNSRLAQELAKWAETQPGGEQIHDALFRAYFVNNVNLAKINNLVVIAEDVGLPKDEAQAVLNKRRFRQEVDADWQESCDQGITGVPTFIIGNRRLVGARPYEQLAALVAASGAAHREE